MNHIFEKKLNSLLERSGYRKLFKLNFLKRYRLKEKLSEYFIYPMIFSLLSLIVFCIMGMLLVLFTLFSGTDLSYNLGWETIFAPWVILVVYATLLSLVNMGCLIEKKYYQHQVISFFKKEENFKALYDTVCLQPYASPEVVQNDFKTIVSEQMEGHDSRIFWETLEKLDTLEVRMLNDFLREHYEKADKLKKIQEKKHLARQKEKEVLIAGKLERLGTKYRDDAKNSDNETINPIDAATIPHDYQKYL